MPTKERTEARLVATQNVLVALSQDTALIPNFCGSVCTELTDLAQKTVYLCGDLSKVSELDLRGAARVFVIREISHGYNESWPLVDMGRVPVLVHGVGVYYRRFFDRSLDLFHRIRTEHTFQSLTESTKPGTAHRTGIYLTPTERHGDELHFRLLRCSTNFAGPSENFRATDWQIVDALNQEAGFIFEGQASLNHVLAQIYGNTPATAGQKQTKARISAHADKTKDMPPHGIMAFCTFYDRLEKLRPLGEFDHGYKEVSGLNRLHFRLKGPVAELPPQFTITLYPNSVFFMPLSTNRLYTHEIQSSMLNAEMLPTRMGYVVRCSSTEAVHHNGRTLLKRGGKLVPLQSPTPEGMQELRRLYAEENKTQAFIDYGDRFPFSMNEGDYLAPDGK